MAAPEAVAQWEQRVKLLICGSVSLNALLVVGLLVAVGPRGAMLRAPQQHLAATGPEETGGNTATAGLFRRKLQQVLPRLGEAAAVGPPSWCSLHGHRLVFCCAAPCFFCAAVN